MCIATPHLRKEVRGGCGSGGGGGGEEGGSGCLSIEVLLQGSLCRLHRREGGKEVG